MYKITKAAPLPTLPSNLVIKSLSLSLSR